MALRIGDNRVNELLDCATSPRERDEGTLCLAGARRVRAEGLDQQTTRRIVLSGLETLLCCRLGRLRLERIERGVREYRRPGPRIQRVCIKRAST